MIRTARPAIGTGESTDPWIRREVRRRATVTGGGFLRQGPPGPGSTRDREAADRETVYLFRVLLSGQGGSDCFLRSVA